MGTLKKLLMFLEMELFGLTSEKFFILQKMETRKKFLIFSQMKAFLVGGVSQSIVQIVIKI